MSDISEAILDGEEQLHADLRAIAASDDSDYEKYKAVKASLEQFNEVVLEVLIS
jgi:hypothetical protein